MENRLTEISDARHIIACSASFATHTKVGEKVPAGRQVVDSTHYLVVALGTTVVVRMSRDLKT